MRSQNLITAPVAALLLLLNLMPLRSAELVMMEQQGCLWCAMWNDQIAPAYPRTWEGKAAPLRRIDIHKPLPEDLAFLAVERYTPTFVLVEDGREIDRIRGYPGDEFFWFMLDEMLAKIGVEAPPSKAPSVQ